MKRTEKIKTFGFLNVDKPSGVVSSVVVNKIKWLSGVPCGHMGTLDPLASGVLPVGIGNATRLFDYFLGKEKVYEAEFTFGVSSDTLDSTGTLSYGGRVPSVKEIVDTLPTLLGEVLQMPPKYSAKNVNGRRGYELARAGIDFTLQAKKVRIYDMELISQPQENVFGVKIRCGGGTYIRSIGRDLAEALGTNAVMSALRRTQSGVFTAENALPFSVLQADPSVEELERYIVPTQNVLPFADFIPEKKDVDKLFNGMTVFTDYANGLYKIYRDDVFYGVLEVVDGRAKIKTKLC